jgi:hypothetical protein
MKFLGIHQANQGMTFINLDQVRRIEETDDIIKFTYANGDVDKVDGRYLSLIDGQLGVTRWLTFDYEAFHEANPKPEEEAA